LCEFLFIAGNAQNYVEMEEIQRNEEAIRNYIIGVAFRGLEDTRRHHKEDGTHQQHGPAGRRPTKPDALYLLEASLHRPLDRILALQ